MKNLLNYFKTLLLQMPQEYWDWANKFLELKRKKIRLNRAIKVADLKTEMDRKRRWIITDWNQNLLIVTNEDIKALKRNGNMSKEATLLDLDREALYHTKKHLA